MHLVKAAKNKTFFIGNFKTLKIKYIFPKKNTILAFLIYTRKRFESSHSLF
jgi:catabolite regulation protein CreA